VEQLVGEGKGTHNLFIFLHFALNTKATWNTLSPELILSPQFRYVNTFTRNSATFFPHEVPIRACPRHVYLGLATHLTDQQTGRNIAGKVRTIQENRGHPVTKNVAVCTDGAPNMSSDAIGAAEQLVLWSSGAVKCMLFFIIVFYLYVFSVLVYFLHFLL
jgi:hypothetical protein